MSFPLEIIAAKAAQHRRVHDEKADFFGVGHSRFFIDRLRAEKGLFTEDVASTHHIADTLFFHVLDGDHEGAVQDKVDLTYLVALGEQFFAFADLSDVREFDNELVGVEADFREDLVVQADLFKAEHLVVGLVIARCPLKVVHKVLHFILAHRHSDIIFWLVQVVAVVVVLR